MSSVKSPVSRREFGSLSDRAAILLGEILIVDVHEIAHEGVDWIHLAYGRVQWLAFVNTVVNLRNPKVHKRQEIFFKTVIFGSPP